LYCKLREKGKKGAKTTMQSAETLLTVPKEFLKAPSGFNLNIVMFLVALGLLGFSICGYWLWGWWDWCCFCADVLALHLAGTIIHDASHNSAHKNRIINSVLGHGSALMLGFAFPVFTRVHLQHHAHVNDPDNDPDHYVSTGGPLWLIAARFFYHEIFFFKRRLWKKYELLEWFLSRLFLFTVVFLGCKYDFIGYVMNFWFVPALVVGIALGLFFDYLPHRPFHDRDRWKNARVYPSPVLNLLILGQNYHLIHHLWPSIP
jgi:beta-carotene hydroxylase